MNKQLLQRRAVGLTPAKPVLRKRRRLAPAAERQARRRKVSTTSGTSREGFTVEIRGKVSRISARSHSRRLVTDIPGADSRAASPI